MSIATAYCVTGTSFPDNRQIRPPSSSYDLKFASGSINHLKSAPIITGCRFRNNGGNSDHATSSDRDWDDWSRHFSEIEFAERSVYSLQLKLEEAIESEDFQEASKIKTAIAEATSKDSVAEIMSELKKAINGERFYEATKLYKNTGSGLVGWWVGYSKDSDNPFGRFICISPGVGRFIGRSYNPSQLLSAAPGIPLFEIFVVKENCGTYTTQAVFMQRAKASSSKATGPSNSLLKYKHFADGAKDEFVRVPAEFEEVEKDSFVFRVSAVIASHGVSELMLPDVAKALWDSNKFSRKVLGDAREKVPEFIKFSRITTSRGDSDPFDGLYVSAFSPFGTEVVLLKRKYGNWSNANDVEFFEYVEAVKVIGDLNVPAGEVTFRAKIGNGGHFSNRGMFMYPDELGVVAGYKGEGRTAEFGFKNPKWVEGELFQLNGKGTGPYVKGADLGFLYLVREQSFFVVFNRLRLVE